MIRSISFSNDYGSSYTFSFDESIEQNDGILITSIDGLGPVKARINMMDLACEDGELFNSARLEGRNIVINFELTDAGSAEDERQSLYEVFPIKEKVYIEIQTDNRQVKTDGYVETAEPNIFDEHPGLQVSILCESPYLHQLTDPNPITLTANSNSNITYSGDVPAGFLLEAEAKSSYITSMTIKKNNEDCLVFDFTKMSGLVPNTAPDGLSVSKAMMVKNGNIYKFIDQLPYEKPAAAFVLDGEIHVVGKQYDPASSGVNVSTITNCKSHYKWNGEVWVKMKDLPYAVFAKATALVLNGVVHLLGVLSSQTTGYSYNTYKHYTYNPNNDSWSSVGNMPSYWGNGIALAVVYNNDIYVITKNLYNAYLNKWISGSTWDEICGVLPSDQETSSTGSRFDYTSSIGVCHGGNHDWIVLVTGVSQMYWYMWRERSEGDEIYPYASYWDDESSTRQLPATMTNATLVRINNTLYAYRPNSKASYYLTYITNPSSAQIQAGMQSGFNWVSTSSTPMSLGGSIACVDGDNVYFIGGASDYSSYATYTENPNDTRLQLDDVVEINTVNGARIVRLNRRGRIYNIINTLGKNPKWFKFVRGSNNIKYTLTTGTTAKVTIKVRNIYTGI